MHVQVYLLNKFQKPLLYKIPTSLEQTPPVGTIVHVPLKNKILPALVVRHVHSTAQATFSIRDIHAIAHYPQDGSYHSFINAIALHYYIKPIQLYHRIQQFLHQATEKKIHEIPLLAEKHVLEDVREVLLTEEQQQVVDYIEPFIELQKYSATLLHGVTGSGKTEVYKKLIKSCLAQQKTALLLLPEVSLSMQFQRILQEQLPDIPIHGFHSASKKSDRENVWRMLCAHKPILLVGVHLPVLLPINNLGLIIIDEEHETGFQEKKHPKINSKEIALLRAHQYKVPILLGSATPSLSSLWQTHNNKWQLFKLKNRFSGSFPTIRKVLLPNNAKKRVNFWISDELKTAIRKCLSHKKQAIIYLNRRGFSFFIQCKECSFVFECRNCSVSLTPHSAQHNGCETIALRCHYCDYKALLPAACPDCKAPEKKFLKKGIGTQQAVQIIRKLFPNNRVERADLDATSKQKAWQETVKSFERGEIDILVGTKTITKGYHFPNVTLVGILWADLTLHFPQYNAGETTLQQLIQVAGRAGRLHHDSTVIVQVMQDHHVFNYINEQTYINFTKSEFEARKETSYPPFCRLICIELRHETSSILEKDAEHLVNLLFHFQKKLNLTIRILGPSHPVVSKIKNIEMRNIFLKANSFQEAKALLSKINLSQFKSKVFVVSSQQ